MQVRTRGNWQPVCEKSPREEQVDDDAMTNCNRAIRKALSLARKLNLLADEGDGAREDAGCGVLFGVVRDCAYKIRSLAEKERDSHIRKGRWD